MSHNYDENGKVKMTKMKSDVSQSPAGFKHFLSTFILKQATFNKQLVVWFSCPGVSLRFMNHFIVFNDLFCRRCVSLPCTCTVLVLVPDKLLHIGRFVCRVCTWVQNLCVRWCDLWLYITLTPAKAAVELNNEASGERPNKNKALLD